jgi:phosphohistidine phosphatase
VGDYVKFAQVLTFYTMKQNKVLQVVRHAKSSWDYDGIADIDRTLKSKGIQNAYDISRKLKLSNQVPDIMVSSPANRALHTAVIFARVLDFSLKDLQISNLLYESSEEKIIDYIKNLPEDHHSLMIFGHNPDVTDLVNHFVKSPVKDVPTSGVVTLVFKCQNWKDISPENLDRELFLFPSKED